MAKKKKSARSKTSKERKGFSNLKPAVTRSARSKLSSGLRKMASKLSRLFLIEFNAKTLLNVKTDIDVFFQNQVWWEEEGQVLVEDTVNRLDDRMKKQFYKDLGSMIGVEVSPVVQELGLKPELENVITETMNSVNAIKKDTQGKVESVINEALITGNIEKGTLASQLKNIINLSTPQRKMFARSVTAKVNGQMNQSRMARAGMSRYQWSTSHDIRVRPSHKAADDKIYNVGEDVIVKVPKVGEVNIKHPGFDWGCRCVAIPLID